MGNSTWNQGFTGCTFAALETDRKMNPVWIRGSGIF